ncbi:MAG: hypothetical protein H6Q52_3167 [Deltaproteobacteria bacterium]|nr:hypothetical protein [Deltaproteobacteria bacterium]
MGYLGSLGDEAENSDKEKNGCTQYSHLLDPVKSRDGELEGPVFPFCSCPDIMDDKRLARRVFPAADNHVSLHNSILDASLLRYSITTQFAKQLARCIWGKKGRNERDVKIK